MAQIPIIESSKVTPAAAPAALMDPNAAAAPWRGLSSVGQGIQSVASVVHDFEVKKQRAADGAGKVSVQVAFNKAKADFEAYRQTNKDSGLWYNKANELLNGVKGQLSQDKTISADARKEIQSYIDLEGGRFLSEVDLAGKQEGIKQSTMRYRTAIEQSVDMGDRAGIVNLYGEMEGLGLIDKATANAELSKALRHADLAEFNKRLISEDMVTLNELEVDLKDGVLSKMDEVDKRRSYVALQEQMGRVRQQTVNDLSMSLQEDGPTPAWREKLERGKDDGSVPATSYKMLNKQADKAATMYDISSTSREINASLDVVMSSNGSTLEKEQALFEIGPAIAALPAGPNKKMLEEKYERILKPQSSSYDAGKEYLDNMYRIGSFGPASLGQPPKKRGKIDEEAWSLQKQKAAEAYNRYADAVASYRSSIGKTNNADDAKKLAVARELSRVDKDVANMEQVNFFADVLPE